MVTPLDPGVYKVTAASADFRPRSEGIELTVGQAARVELTLAISACRPKSWSRPSAAAQHRIGHAQPGDLQRADRRPAAERPELPRAGAADAGCGAAAAERQLAAGAPEIVNGNIMGGVSGRKRAFCSTASTSPRSTRAEPGSRPRSTRCRSSACSRTPTPRSSTAPAARSTSSPSRARTVSRQRFEFLRNDAFDEKNFFAQTKEKLERNQFGGTFGGPVVIPGLVDGRGKTFFFASYEGQRRKSGAVDVAIVPSPAQRQGNFQGLAPIYDPLTTVGTTRTQFAGNVIPQERIAAAAAFFLRYIPLPNGPNNTWVSSPIVEFNQDQFTFAGITS